MGVRMTSQTLTNVQEPQTIESRLQPNAISTAQDTVIGMAYAAPTLSVGLTLAGLAAATSYAVGPIILLTAVPMIIIANAYRRLNLWNANTGASFEWVGRAINPYLGHRLWRVSPVPPALHSCRAATGAPARGDWRCCPSAG